MHRSRGRSPLSIAVLGLALAGAPAGAAVQTVYDNALQNGWQDWSWAVHNLSQTAVHQSAPSAISWEPDSVGGDWKGIYFHSNPGAADPAVAGFTAVRFWINGNGGHQAVRLVIYRNDAEIGSKDLTPLPNVWTQMTVTWADLGIATTGSFDGIIFQTNTPGAADQATAYVDDLELVESGGGSSSGGPVTVAVDPNLDRRAINPLIYGVNWASSTELATGLYTANRRGGNATTRYNWLFDTSNRAMDYYFLNINEGGANGASADNFVAPTLAAGAAAVMTMPIDQVAKSAARLPGFSTTKYGPQTDTECTWNPGLSGCGNNGNGICNPAINTTLCAGVRCCNPASPAVPGSPSLRYITGNSAADTSVPVDLEAHVGAFASHLVSLFGSAAATGVRYYNLDNEPMLWNSTHRDAHPAAPDYDEVWNKGLAAATKIKSHDAGAEILGPDTWGWCDFWTSAKDAAAGDCLNGTDRAAHGNLPWPAWYMQQSCAHRLPAGHPAAGDLPIDWLDVHFYPQGDGVAGLSGNQSAEDDAATVAARLRSLKELYDPAWISESWIADGTIKVVQLIPQMRAWRDQYCPEMKLALSEYRWGKDNTLSGALAQAEALAIFGREGLDMALRWVVPDAGSLAEDSYRLYRNYDGAGGKVSGDTVRAVSSDVDGVGSYAVRAANGNLFVLLFNKDTVARDVTVTVNGGVAGTVALWRLDSAGLNGAGTLGSTATGFATTLPPRTATLARVQLAASASLIFADGFETGNTSQWVP
ncbi:MAG TPA: glycoside hydrolase family 44 protein [Thermoanaerobaculia bacterium]|nr:glycoside hydrolase family 44 protein [Thermoanaerobaculia bacterium]